MAGIDGYLNPTTTRNILRNSDLPGFVTNRHLDSSAVGRQAMDNEGAVPLLPHNNGLLASRHLPLGSRSSQNLDHQIRLRESSNREQGIRGASSVYGLFHRNEDHTNAAVNNIQSGEQQRQEQLRLLNAQIDLHRRHNRESSLLSRFTGWLAENRVTRFFTGSQTTDDSLHALTNLRHRLVNNSNYSLNNTQITNLIEQDSRRLASYDNFTQTANGFLKSATLFMRGGIGLGATIATHACDRFSAASNTRITDGILGGITGAAMRGTFRLADRGITAVLV